MAFLAFTTWARLGASDWKQKLINLLIIFAWMTAGIAVGFLLGGPTILGGQMAASFTAPFGAVGAFGCTRGNKHRAKKAAATAT
jgi:hypothetical protein